MSSPVIMIDHHHIVHDHFLKLRICLRCQLVIVKERCNCVMDVISPCCRIFAQGVHMSYPSPVLDGRGMAGYKRIVGNKVLANIANRHWKPPTSSEPRSIPSRLDFLLQQGHVILESDPVYTRMQWISPHN